MQFLIGGKKLRKRIYGIDIAKIVACMQVVWLHTSMRYFTGNYQLSSSIDREILRILYIMSGVAIPVFFMANGYFILNKKELTISYVWKKTCNILVVILGWLLMYSILNYLKDRDFLFFKYALGTVIPGIPNVSTFIHLWFFWTLIILLWFAIYINKILHRNIKLYAGIILLLFFICIIVNILSYINESPIDKHIYQPFRIYQWLMYYMLGGYVGYFKDRIFSYYRTHRSKVILLTLTSYAAFSVVIFFTQTIMGTLFIEYSYGNILCIVSSLLLYILFLCHDYKSITKKKKKKIIPLTMGIYIVHPIIIKHVVYVVDVKNIYQVLAMYIIILFVSICMTYIVRKMPILSKLVKI